MRPIIFLLASLTAVVGCGWGGGDRRAEVSGTVRVDGQPLASGAISFRPTEGTEGPSSGGQIVGGRYSVSSEKGVAVGKNRIAIHSYKKTGRKVEGNHGGWEDEMVEAIPPKYNYQSELVRTVEPGSNQLDFDLQVGLARETRTDAPKGQQ